MQRQFFILAAICCLAAAQDDCPPVVVQEVFDITAYIGKWFEIERVPTPFEPYGSCVTATYTPQNDTTYPVRVYNTMYNENEDLYHWARGAARPADDSGDGKLKVRFPVTKLEANHWILETDYLNYSLVFSCNDYDGVFTRSSWILSRTPVLNTAASVKVEAAIVRNGLDRDAYEVTRQDADCDYTQPPPPKS